MLMNSYIKIDGFLLLIINLLSNVVLVQLIFCGLAMSVYSITQIITKDYSVAS